MDLTFYRDIIPYESFTGFDDGAEVVVPCFSVARPGSVSGYRSGANLLIHRLGEGRVVLSTLRLLEHLGKHSAADRIMLNFISYSMTAVSTR